MPLGSIGAEYSLILEVVGSVKLTKTLSSILPPNLFWLISNTGVLLGSVCSNRKSFVPRPLAGTFALLF